LLNQSKNFFNARFNHTGQRLAAEHAGSTVTQPRHLNLLFGVGKELFCAAAFHLDVFGIFGGRAQGHRNIVGDEIASNWNDRCMADSTSGVDGHIRRASTNINQSYTQLFFVVGEHGMA